MRIHVLAVGRLRGAYAELCAEYSKRLMERVVIKEITAASAEAEGKALLKAVPEKAFIVTLDERGKDISSRELAIVLAKWRDRGLDKLVFIIGGADGLTDEVKAKADFSLSLGQKTWPHKLVRVMLLEQLYRVQQINTGHPYHRD